MTGYKSKRDAALDEEGMYLVHQTARDQAIYGMSVTQGGKRIDPMSIYAQPAQEPVAWMFQHEETGRTMCVDAQQVEWGFEKGKPRLKKIAPLYTAPPQRKPLTDDQIKEIWLNGKDHGDDWLDVQGIARAIEAAHGITGVRHD
jgi:hypothetical protein